MNKEIDIEAFRQELLHLSFTDGIGVSQYNADEEKTEASAKYEVKIPLDFIPLERYIQFVFNKVRSPEAREKFVKYPTPEMWKAVKQAYFTAVDYAVIVNLPQNAKYLRSGDIINFALYKSDDTAEQKKAIIAAINYALKTLGASKEIRKLYPIKEG